MMFACEEKGFMLKVQKKLMSHLNGGGGKKHVVRIKEETKIFKKKHRFPMISLNYILWLMILL